MGLHSGPVSSAVPETDSSHFGLSPQRSHKQNWPPTWASCAQLPRTASHVSPPRTRQTRHTDSPVSHTTGAHGNPSHGPRLHTLRTLHTTHSTRWEGSSGRGAPLTQPPRTHAPPATCQPPSCSCEAAPLSCRANKRLFLSAPQKKGCLSPGPDGRGSRSRRSNTAALSHPVALGGPGLWCAEIHEPCGFLRSAPFQRRSPILLHPICSSQLCFLCLQTVQDGLHRLLGIPLFLAALRVPLQGALKRLVLHLLFGDSMPSRAPS